ncbi:MAG: FHA domain-containing protein [Lacisediminihabitans sp.]
MHDDLYDTVVVPPRRDPQPDDGIDDDTIVPVRRAEPATVAPPSEVTPLQPPAESCSVAPEKVAKKRRDSEDRTPALVEPAPPRSRRVPLTHKRVQETLRAPEVAHEPSVLAPVHPVAPTPVYGFRVGDRAPISLDVPVLIGRKPAAPRIPGNVLPRLVRVSSPLSEVSGTHLELRQEGSSVIVTDLRSTNGTIVRMPGFRPVKLRQGESLVVRPGTLVDIGDGNVFEILPPPRLSVTEDAVGDGMWA